MPQPFEASSSIVARSPTRRTPTLSAEPPAYAPACDSGFVVPAGASDGRTEPSEDRTVRTRWSGVSAGPCAKMNAPMGGRPSRVKYAHTRCDGASDAGTAVAAIAAVAGAVAVAVAGAATGSLADGRVSHAPRAAAIMANTPAVATN